MSKFIGNTTAESIEFAVDHLIEIGLEAIQKKGAFTLALSGGSTPKAIYQMLSKSKKNALDWSKVWIFFSDERCVPPSSDESNYKMAMDHGIGSLGIPETHIFRMKGELDPSVAASEYETLIKKHVPNTSFDLIMLGCGDDGHTASLFPDTKALDEVDKLVVSNWVPKLNTHRITFTYPLINKASNINIYILGISKADIVEDILTTDGKYPIQKVAPANTLYILDKGSASKLY